jgi:phospholipase C
MVRKRLITALLVCSVILPAAAAAKTVARTAAAAETPGATATKSLIQHIVVLYLENHSFDSLLGYWCDNHPRRCPRGGMPSSVRLSNGAVVKPSHAPDVVPIVAHDVDSQLAAMNIRHGVPRMNGWQNIVQGECAAANGYQCISGYLPRQEPNLSMLADKFAISDATFSLADSPSWGGHLYIVTSNLDGFTGDIPIIPLGVPGTGGAATAAGPQPGPLPLAARSGTYRAVSQTPR